MMYELSKVDYHKIKAMINRTISSNAFLSVIDGYSLGAVFVDSKDNPATALVWSKGLGGFGIFGKNLSKVFVNEFHSFLNQHLIPLLKTEGHTGFEGNCITESLNASLLEMVSKRNPYQWKQHLYTFDKTPIKGASFETRANTCVVNNALLSSEVNTTLIEDTIHDYWRSMDEFLLTGIGYCCIENNCAVSLSYSSFISDTYYEIGIETLADYRQKGYAYAAAYAVLEEVLLRGKTPFWECAADNIASASTAEKLGFRKKLSYTCIGFKL